jgi:site-specific DNA recombinase
MPGRQEKGVAGDGPAGAGAAAPIEATVGGIEVRTGAGRSGPAGGHLRLAAALYARVSTDRQESQQTVDSQLDALRRAADEGGYEVLEEYVFVDENYSGSRLDRPGLERLRDLASEGTFEAVFIYSPDRLARQYAYQVVVIEELQKTGCEVVFLNHAFGQSPEEQMLLQIQGVFAEYERALIRERTRRGRLFAARQGRVNWRVAPYGFRLVRKTETTPQQLLVDETEAEVVRQMYRWLVEEELTSYAIAKRLRERAVPTRKNRKLGWAQSTVIEILRDPTYKGEAYYNRTKAADAKRPRMSTGYKDLRPGNGRSRAKRPREEWIPVRVPAIVDPETWELAQEQLKKNRQRAQRNNTKHRYLLRSLLICGRCGRRMIGMWDKRGGRYVCSMRYPRHRPYSCDGRTVAIEKIEPYVWEYVKELLSEPKLLKVRYEEGKGDPAVDAKEEREKERIGRKLKALEREIGRLIDANPRPR